MPPPDPVAEVEAAAKIATAEANMAKAEATKADAAARMMEVEAKMAQLEQLVDEVPQSTRQIVADALAEFFSEYRPDRLSH